MKKLLLLVSMICATFAMSAQEEKAPINQELSQELSAIQTAMSLAKLGYDTYSPTALVEAARILAVTEYYETELEKETSAVVEVEEKDNALSFNPTKFLADAKEMAGKDKTLLALIKNTEKIVERAKQGNVKLIEIQRSRGYAYRNAFLISEMEDAIKAVKEADKNVIVMVDNCYGEFTDIKEPTEIGADICVGSLIKNLGGGIAPNGAYIAGKKDLVELCGERLTLPGEGKEVGPSLGINKSIIQGLYMAPSAVASSLKTVILTSLILEKLGNNVSPKYNEKRADIVETIIFNDPEKLIKFTEGIQLGSAIDAHVSPVPSDMPGYTEQVIMASGSFTQGSSIEISCDGPLREPFIAYLQGSLTYEYGKLAILSGINNLLKD